LKQLFIYGNVFLVKERETRKDILYGVDDLSVKTNKKKPDISK
jgi:hypothetical protein